MYKALSVFLGLVLASSACLAQAPAHAEPIKSQNILNLQPDADTAPGYAKQTNGQRALVQSGNNAPMWRDVGAGVAGRSSLPKTQAPEAGVLIQPKAQYPGSRVTSAGEAWRQVRNQWIIPYGGALLLIALGGLVLFYLGKGPMKLKHARSGRKVQRFTAFERAAHWANAIAFVILAVSGAVMAFGKFFILPVIGSTLFGWLTYALKNAHNFAGPLFAVSLFIVFVTFMRDNMPSKGDLAWLMKGGGMFSGEHVSSGRFNAGEKVIFWCGVLTLGVIVVLSGLALDHLLPGVDTSRSTMQIANMVHGVATVLMMAMFALHIYLGTVGVEGAYEGMRTGYVDETWAKEHHDLWLDDIKSGRIPAQRGGAASAPPSATAHV
jgi:formate dehydrogenase subunit gamma